MKKAAGFARRARGRSAPAPAATRAVDGFGSDSSSSTDRMPRERAGQPQFLSDTISADQDSQKNIEEEKGKELLSSRSHAARVRSGVLASQESISFLDELKTHEETRSRVATGGLENIDVSKPGSHDQGDPSTTNIFVGHLSADVDEIALQRVFGEFGPIASVKIMWPRTEEEFRRGHNSGFVCFMHREDAYAALQNLNETKLSGKTIRLAWGRALRRTSVPMPPAPGQAYGRTSKPWGTDIAMERANPSLPVILVQPPLDLERRREINRLAMDVAAAGNEGSACENSAVDRDKLAALPRFGFLWQHPRDGDNQENGIYYRWKVFSLCNGDTETRWRTAPFAMEAGGSLWNPPPCLCPINNPEVTASDDLWAPARIERGARGALAVSALQPGESPDGKGNSGKKMFAAGEGGSLGETVRELRNVDESLRPEDEKELRAVLAGLTTSRASIAHAMVFCLDQSAHAGSVVAMVLERVTAQVAEECARKDGGCWDMRLVFLLSDILHNMGNCGVPRASAYRLRIERALPVVFAEVGKMVVCLRDSRRDGWDAVGEAMEGVVDSWQRSYIYPKDALDLLRAKLGVPP